MKKVKEIIRLYEEARMSFQQIAYALNLSRPAVTNILIKWKESDYTFQKIKNLQDSKLEEKIFSDKKSPCISSRKPISHNGPRICEVNGNGNLNYRTRGNLGGGEAGTAYRCYI